jgi:hypothetical protein
MKVAVASKIATQDMRSSVNCRLRWLLAKDSCSVHSVLR